MAAQSTTTETAPLTQAEQDEFLDLVVAQSARAALREESPFWDAISQFIDMFRDMIRNTLVLKLEHLPIIGTWASRVAVTVSELIFTLVGTLLHFLKTIFSAKRVWIEAHTAALTAWKANEDKGLLAQTYAYSKKMAGYFLEIIKQCLERAIKTQGLEMTQAEVADISKLLDEIL
ncbi:uncharacterized protein LOC110860454 [Folsomia candida]|uniref:Uncharacterized protein n=1 Tax=Folsomia candida TaxID=158441 RepID=A0A226D6I1_FOLCA|nr:uncharacterized protein LOC110860454 [Folsomia candida]XP_021965188.1 uncharacterized protein LOC110860454 [Folsomia candida]XP_021965189.1 uncharacterized protein LOC110860454 [Folsomia candida]XP_021965190.1 uncharacterized protein LOC110860454 [Folsomia candida]XP_021965191.1 uncharacterized protein LOC110860454 [Folsomia candida]XP_021965192.1 uncharacterized protein LOC110860454 [Folsomia candida]OXA40720.1 hypothetical protein Fcan01_24597 [Folsomia candida]